MAIAAVKTTRFTADAASANVSVNATAGNALIVGGAAYSDNSAPGSWTATRTGDTYTIDNEGISSASIDRHRNGIASAPNVAGGAVTLTLAVTNASSIDGWGLELSGLPTSSIRDATSPALKTGTDNSAETNSLTNTTANAIFITVVGSEDGTNPSTVTAPSGYTVTVSAVTMTSTNGSVDQVGGMGYKIVSTVAAEAPVWATTIGNWSTTIAVYKASGAAQDTPELYGRPDGLRGQRQLTSLLAQ